MPREPRMKLNCKCSKREKFEGLCNCIEKTMPKPSEIIREISKKYSHWKLKDTTPDYTGIKAQAIIDFLDEQYEKEEPQEKKCTDCEWAHSSFNHKCTHQDGLYGKGTCKECRVEEAKEAVKKYECATCHTELQEGKLCHRCASDIVKITTTYPWHGNSTIQIPTSQDPKYCSVSGRTADKHVFEEETTAPKNPACGVTDQMLGEPVSERNRYDRKYTPPM